MKKNRIQELEKELLGHKELYYQGKAVISDEAFDALEAELKKLDPALVIYLEAADDKNPLRKLRGVVINDDRI